MQKNKLDKATSKNWTENKCNFIIAYIKFDLNKFKRINYTNINYTKNLNGGYKSPKSNSSLCNFWVTLEAYL